MNRIEFLNRLKEDLSSLSDEERQNALKYYEEYFADAAEDDKYNISDQFVSPDELAHKIELELSDHARRENEEKETVFEAKIEKTEKTEKSKEYANQRQCRGNNGNSTAKIVLLLCTAPIWLPLLIGAASTAFGLFMALVGVSFAVASIALAGFVMVGAGFMSVGYGIFNIFADATMAFWPLGAGLVVAGIGIIMAALFTKVSAIMFKSEFKAAAWVISRITGKYSRQSA